MYVEYTCMLGIYICVCLCIWCTCRWVDMCGFIAGHTCVGVCIWVRCICVGLGVHVCCWAHLCKHMDVGWVYMWALGEHVCLLLGTHVWVYASGLGMSTHMHV